MAKRILLVKPSLPTPNLHVNAPLGLMYLASSARYWADEPVTFQLIDMRISHRTVKKVVREFQDFDPEVVALSAFTYEAPMMHDLARAFKALKPDVKIIAGGPHPTIMPEKVVGDPNIDYAVMGEGEKTFTKLLDHIFVGEMPADIPGTAVRRDGEVKKNGPAPPIEELDLIPFPAWDLIQAKDYTSPRVRNMNWIVLNRKAMPIFTSRGCPYQCVYCHPVFGKKHRTRSVQNVIHEIEALYIAFGVRELHIIDDVFNFDRKRALEIMKKIEESPMEVKIAFPNGLRGDLMDEASIEAYKRAGTYMMIFAVETASPRLQKYLKKNLDLEKTREAIERVDRAGLFVKGFFMLGFPTETPEEMTATIDFAASTKLHVASFFQVVPFPGTEMFEMARKDFPGIDRVYADLKYYGDTSYYETVQGVNLSSRQRAAYRKFYFSLRRLWKIVRRIPRKRYLLSGFFLFLSYAVSRPFAAKRKEETQITG